MGVTIIKNGKTLCGTCRGSKQLKYSITSQGKEVTLTLPCYVCAPISRLPYMGLQYMQSIAKDVGL